MRVLVLFAFLCFALCIYPFGVQTDLNVTALSPDWSLCYSSTFNDTGGDPVSSVLNDCGATYFVMACGLAGSGVLHKAAFGQIDVFRNFSASEQYLTYFNLSDANFTAGMISNGVGFYFIEMENATGSVGFAPFDATFFLDSCDLSSDADRMCISYDDFFASSGYRCGENVTDKAEWVRVFYAVNTTEPPCDVNEIYDGNKCINSSIVSSSSSYSSSFVSSASSSSGDFSSSSSISSSGSSSDSSSSLSSSSSGGSSSSSSSASSISSSSGSSDSSSSLSSSSSSGSSSSSSSDSSSSVSSSGRSSSVTSSSGSSSSGSISSSSSGSSSTGNATSDSSTTTTTSGLSSGSSSGSSGSGSSSGASTSSSSSISGSAESSSTTSTGGNADDSSGEYPDDYFASSAEELEVYLF